MILNSEGWQLVAEKKLCSGVKSTGKGYRTSVDDCAEACAGIAPLFAFGTNDYGLAMCDKTGNCLCYCYNGANDDGTCRQSHNDGYRLYKYENSTKGETIFIEINQLFIHYLNFKLYYNND